MLVEMHPAARLAVQRLGHKGDGLTVVVGGHLGNILDQHGAISGRHQSHHRRLDLRLTGTANFMVVVFYWHAHRLQLQRHLAAQVEELVFGRYGMIATMQRNVVSVAAGSAVPIGLIRIQTIRGMIDPAVESHVIEDVELELRPPQAAVGNPAVPQVSLGADGDVARVVGKHLVRIRFQRRADEAQGGCFPERVDESAGQVGYQNHITRFDAFQPDRRAIEANSAFQDSRRKLAGGDSKVVPASPQVTKFEIDQPDGVFVDKALDLVEKLEHG